MRSLKIIVFRDTDKPHTMILPASVLILCAFGVVALFSLLVFSVMGNIMLFASGEEPPPPRQVAAAGEQAGQADDPRLSGRPAGEEPRDDPEQEPVEQTEGPDQGEPAEAGPFGIWEAENNQFMAELERGPRQSGNRVLMDVRIAVLPRAQDGQPKVGKFAAVLISEDMQRSATYPSRIEVEQTDVANPERGTTFRAARYKIENVEFPGANLSDYSAYALFIFDEESNELLWRTVQQIER